VTEIIANSPPAEAPPEEPRITPNARAVLEKRYLLRDAEGRIVETPGGMLRRVARAIAAPEEPRIGREASHELARRYERAMRDLDFLPNSPTLMNAGTPLGNLAACFVVPVPDEMGGIFEAVKRMALIHKTGGGTGFSFSRLRPRDDHVASTGGIASGPVPFIGVFDAATDAVRQGGRRRGANMGILRVDHPDVLEFIGAKRAPGRLRNFNISVAATDAFMRAVASDGAYALVNPRTRAPSGEVRARPVFDAIVEAAWRTGDPGLVFIDAVNRAHPTPAQGEIEATNPCGEMPLLPYEACNLGSVNLARFVREGRLDRERLGEAVDLAVRFLDDVIDAARYPFPEIDAVVRANRKVGLGVMGFAEMLARVGVSYADPEALEVAGDVMSFIEARAQAASRALARERGPFPAWAASRLAAEAASGGAGPLRNATVTSIAPTGTISIIAGTSSGIEPFYALAFVRHVLDGAELPELEPLFEEEARAAGILDRALVERLLAEGSLARIPGVPDRLRRLFVTAADVPPEQHVRMQAAFQRHCDNGVSKTVNLPPGASADDVRRCYLLAWELGCKGITVFRSGSKGEQVLAGRTGAAAERAAAALVDGDADSVCRRCAP
jgi:ribonucleoside-diphosphate reductase alpha chain